MNLDDERGNMIFSLIGLLIVIALALGAAVGSLMTYFFLTQ